MIYRFDNFVLDVDGFQLSKSNGEPIPIQRRALELLLLLVRNASLVVTKDAINREVWGGLHVSRNALPFQLAALREALGDAEKPHRLIETVHSKGVRFTAEVTQEERSKSLAPPSLKAEHAELELPEAGLIGDQPTIAILRFADMSEDGELAGLADALPVDVMAALSRLKVLRVISRSSSFLLDANDVKPSLVKSILGANYAVSGTVSRAGEKLYIFAELIDNSTQHMVWSDTYEIDPRDIHSVRASIVGQIVERIHCHVPKNEADRSRLLHPQSLTAWQAFHLGRTLMQQRGIDNALGARVYFERAVGIDPGFAAAWAGLAETYSYESVHLPWAERQKLMRKMLNAAERALEADGENPAANLWMGRALAIKHSGAQALDWCDRAVEQAPSYALAHQQLGTIHTELGDYEKAREHSHQSLMLNPQGHERYANYAIIAGADFTAGRMDEALNLGRKAGCVAYDDLNILIVGLCANHLSSERDEAARIAARIRTAFPQLMGTDTIKTGVIGTYLGPAIRTILSEYEIN